MDLRWSGLQDEKATLIGQKTRAGSQSAVRTQSAVSGETVWESAVSDGHAEQVIVTLWTDFVTGTVRQVISSTRLFKWFPGTFTENEQKS